MQLPSEFRNHGLYILEKCLKSFITMAVTLALAFLSNSGKEKLEEVPEGVFGFLLFVFVFFMLIRLGMHYARWRYQVFTLKEMSLVSKQGIFNQEIRELPFDKIHSQSTTQNIFQRLTGLVCIKIDTGSAGSTLEPEITLVLKAAAADLLVQTIEKRKSGANLENSPPNANAEPETRTQESPMTLRYSIGIGDIFKMSVTGNILLPGIVFIGLLLNEGRRIVGFLNKMGVVAELPPWDQQSLFLWWFSVEGFFSNVISGLFWIFFLIMAFLIFSGCISFVTNCIRFYSFEVRSQGERWHIRYGLLQKHAVNFELSKVKAVLLTQNILQRALGVWQLKIEIVGLGDEKGETALLFPLLAEASRERIFSELLPNFWVQGDILRPPADTLKLFLLRWLWLPFVVAMAASLLYPKGYLTFLVLPFFIIPAVLEYKNTGLAKNAAAMFVQQGAMTRQQGYIRLRDIQSVTLVSSYFQRKKALSNFKLSYQTNRFGSGSTLRHLSLSELGDYENFH